MERASLFNSVERKKEERARESELNVADCAKFLKYKNLGGKGGRVNALTLQCLRETLARAMKQFLKWKYDLGTAAAFAAALTLCVGTSSIKIAAQTAAKNYAKGYLKDVFAQKSGMEREYLILNCCFAAAKAFYCSCRLTGVASYRWEMRRLFRVASEQLQAARWATGTARKRRTAPGVPLGENGGYIIDAHNDGNKKSDGCNVAWAVAC